MKILFSNSPMIKNLSSDCHLCSKKLQNVIALKHHLKNVHSVRPYKCKICNETFERRKDMGLHVRKEHLGINDSEIYELDKGKKFSAEHQYRKKKKKFKRKRYYFFKTPSRFLFF